MARKIDYLKIDKINDALDNVIHLIHVDLDEQILKKTLDKDAILKLGVERSSIEKVRNIFNGMIEEINDVRE